MELDFLLDGSIRLSSILVIFIFSTMLSGSIVRVGNGFGFIRGGRGFQPFWTLFPFYILEGLFISVSMVFLEVPVTNWLNEYKVFVPSIVSSSIAIFLLWFCRINQFDIRWRAFSALNIPAGITIILSYLKMI